MSEEIIAQLERVVSTLRVARDHAHQFDVDLSATIELCAEQIKRITEIEAVVCDDGQ